MKGRDLYEEAVYLKVKERINRLQPDTQPQWGKMDAAQMLDHCAEIQEVMNGKALKGTPWFIKLFSNFVKKAVTNKKPYSHNLQTHPQYRVSSPREFEASKERLLNALEEFYTTNPNEMAAKPHALFGPMSAEEKSWAAYKHLDHHLTQFGV